MIPHNRKSIGVFDSGIGGLTVVHALMKRLPNENLTYFGDTARVPYGSKSIEVVREYAIQDAQFLIDQGVKMIVVACNTVSAVAIDDLRARFQIPIIGMILPGAHVAERESKLRKVGVIGTLATIASDSYTKALHSIDPEISVVSGACPLFVPLAEEGWSDHKVSHLVAEEYLAPLRKEGIDTLILGCTHYPILKKVIRNAIGENVLLVDSGEAAAEEVESMLMETNLLNDSIETPGYSFYVSDVPQKFKELGEIFLGVSHLKVTKIHI